MKISKLFHWLYASIMLLPIFAIVGKCLYVSFNPNAKESYYAETINEKENIYVNDNFKNNEVYYLSLPNNGLSVHNINGDISTTTINISLISIETNNTQYDYTHLTKLGFWSATNSLNYNVKFYDNNNQEILNTSNTTTNQYLIKFYMITPSESFKTFTANNEIVYKIEYNNYSYLDNNLYYSVYQISQEGLFSWANTSFLSVPFTYITDLFGMPSSSPIITLLSYWLNISIIWLTFDVLMYVPLLVHRWLDKGVLE